jgi:hypothetical protein
LGVGASIAIGCSAFFLIGSSFFFGVGLGGGGVKEAVERGLSEPLEEMTVLEDAWESKAGFDTSDSNFGGAKPVLGGGSDIWGY